MAYSSERPRHVLGLEGVGRSYLVWKDTAAVCNPFAVCLLGQIVASLTWCWKGSATVCNLLRACLLGNLALWGLVSCLHCMQDLLREELAELLKLSGSSFKVELIMRLLGLTHARNTMIGSAMVGWV